MSSAISGSSLAQTARRMAALGILLSACSGGKDSTAPTQVLTTVVVSLSPASIPVGQTATASASGTDQNGAAMAVGPVTWTTGSSSTATVTASGIVTGVAPGQALITATVGAKSGSVGITVNYGATSVALSAPGQSTAFLSSPDFSAALTVQPGSQYLIAVVNTDTSNAFVEDFTLATSFGAVSASNVASGPVKARQSAAVRAPSASGPRIALPNSIRQRIALAQQSERNHIAILEENRQIYARLFSQGAFRARSQPQPGRSLLLRADVTPTIGAVNKVYVRRVNGTSCNAVDSIGARTVAVAPHVIVLADTNQTAWPQAFRPDSTWYQTFANEYDQITYPHLLNYIGDPLGYDASLSGAGKVTVTLTPDLNNIPGLPGGYFVAAFVNPCDFAPFQATGPDQLFSNQTEMMYSMVPSASTYTVAEWEAELRATAAHESKHIVSFTDRILNNSAQFEESWLEEGLAQISAEVWERHFNLATWKGHATFVQTVACEYNLGLAASCDLADNLPWALMFGHLPDTWSYLLKESTTNTEGLGVDVPSKYGAGWNFARWVIDQYAPAGGEGAFIQSLINTTTTGVNTLSSPSGQSAALLLTYWNVASAIFETPAYTAADVRTTTPSFNFADIFQVGQTGLPGYNGWTCGGTPCGFFAYEPPTPVYPVAPIAFSSGTFSRTINAVPGTAASFFLLSGTTAGTETLNLFSGSGGALPGTSGFRVAILRVQ